MAKRVEIIKNGNFDFSVNSGDELEIISLIFDENDHAVSLNIDLVGENASVKVRSLAFVTGSQSIDNLITVKHLSQNCKSDILYKSVLKDVDSKYSWRGNVVITADATGTQTYEENRNMLLTRGAAVTSEPNLEILTGNIVSAGHASATGRFEDEQLFYLQSRGIDEITAKKLVTVGFFAAVLEELNLEEDELYTINQYIDEKLSES